MSTKKRYNRPSVQIARSGNLSSEPCYKMTTPRTKIKLTREVEAAIDELLEKNEQKKQQGLGKQMLKRRTFMKCFKGKARNKLLRCNYISKRESTRKEAYIRQVYRPGELASLTG